MSNDCLIFSSMFFPRLTSKEGLWATETLVALSNLTPGTSATGILGEKTGFPDDIGVESDWGCDMGFDWQVLPKEGIWICAQEMIGDPVGVGMFVQSFLKMWRPDEFAFFEWVYEPDCIRKPPPGASQSGLGGGAALVTAAEYQTVRTDRWVEERVARWNKSRKIRGPGTSLHRAL